MNTFEIAQIALLSIAFIGAAIAHGRPRPENQKPYLDTNFWQLFFVSQIVLTYLGCN